MSVAAPRATRLRQCVILAGGLGTRLGSITAVTPKPVLSIGGRPFLALLLRELQRFGFEEALLLTGHLAGTLRQEVMQAASALPKPMSIVFAVEPEPLGTAGALRHAASLLDPYFLLCNGDSLLDTNLAPLLAAARKDPPGSAGRLLLRSVDDTTRYGRVSRTGERVEGFEQNCAGSGDIHAGLAVFSRDLLPELGTAASLEREVFPKLAAEGRLMAQPANGYFVDIGIPADLERARADLPNRLRRPALFLDRDGVINADHGYVGTRERFEFTPTALAAIARASAAGWHVFIVTNQSGVARGLYTEADVQSLHEWLLDQALQAGGTIDDIRYCPYHPDGSVAAYARASDWRKPGPGMLLDLIGRWQLDPARCHLIGDQPSDLQAADAAGIAGHHFDGGDLDALVARVMAG